MSADLVVHSGRVVFPDVTVKADVAVTLEYMQSAAAWELHDGWKPKGPPVQAIVRGEVVMEDGQIVGGPRHCVYVPRHSASSGPGTVWAGVRRGPHWSAA